MFHKYLRILVYMTWVMLLLWLAYFTILYYIGDLYSSSVCNIFSIHKVIHTSTGTCINVLITFNFRFCIEILCLDWYFLPTHRENPSKSNEKRSMKMTNEKKLDIQYNGLEICKLFFLINFWIHKTGFSFTGIAYFLIFRHTLSTGNKYCCVSIFHYCSCHTQY